MDGGERRICVVDEQEDPLEPSRFRHRKRIKRRDESEIAPLQRAPSRKVSKEDYEAWKVPRCVSNWKNPRGHIVPLEKRVESEERTRVDINEKFVEFSEAMWKAEKEVQGRIETRKKKDKEMKLRERQEREERLKRLAETVGREEGEAGLDERKERGVVYDGRLYGKEKGMGSGFGTSEEHELYDKPLFERRGANVIYKYTRRRGRERPVVFERDDVVESGDKGKDSGI